jgi:NADPH:quinone reductase
MKEMTAHHFATGFYAVKPGDVALVNARRRRTDANDQTAWRAGIRPGVDRGRRADRARGGSRSCHRRKHGVLTYYGPIIGSPKPIDIATLCRERLSVDKSQQLMCLRANFAIGMLP